MKASLPLLLLCCLLPPLHAKPILIEAESFKDHGGWKLDTQFIETMGSPYLLAHGLGKPVADAKTTITVEKQGAYRVWIRTRDWVARWKAPGAPGKFALHINDKPLDTIFGTVGADWHWQDGGSVKLPAGEVNLKLHDLTGFGGRCDAILFSPDPDFVPDNASEILPAWRREMLGFSSEPKEEGPFDLVVVGGGYAGTCAAISAARMGIKVALIQNRGVLGGNGSSEVRVWAKGNTPDGLYPVGDIVNELTDYARASPGTYEEFGDAKKERITRAEKNLSLYLWHHGSAVEMKSDASIRAVQAFDVRTSELKRFTGTLFADCTGHGFIAMKAGAEGRMEPGGRMGMSNMWRWKEGDAPAPFPDIPWALDLDEADFPYPRRHHAEWFWESGYNKHPIQEREDIRDWNHRAAYGAWNAIKNKGAYARYDETGKSHANASLEWMAYIGGTRETQQFYGDVILTQEDVVSKREFKDGCVLTTWSIDLHYPKEQYLTKYKDNPFIAKAVHGKGVDRKKGYPIPYRCFYSRNIENLFLAGRNVSVTHQALGTVRVMKTCGMMGVVVGRAAAVCKKEQCTPRDVYESYLYDLIELCKLPGRAYRETIESEFVIPTAPPPHDVPSAASKGIPIDRIPGLVIDDTAAKLEGDWTHSQYAGAYIGKGYTHDANKNKGKARATFPVRVKEPGIYRVSFSWRGGGGRAANVPLTVQHALGETRLFVNQSVPPEGPHDFFPIGEYLFQPDKPGNVVISNEGTEGYVIIDAIRLVPVK